jgi:two-component system response regulator CpxR
MLEILLRRAGAVVTREELAQAALGRPLSAFDRSVDVHVSRLRKKLGCVHGGEERIRPVRGIGYFYVLAARVAP